MAIVLLRFCCSYGQAVHLPSLSVSPSHRQGTFLASTLPPGRQRGTFLASTLPLATGKALLWPPRSRLATGKALFWPPFLSAPGCAAKTQPIRLVPRATSLSEPNNTPLPYTAPLGPTFKKKAARSIRQPLFSYSLFRAQLTITRYTAPELQPFLAINCPRLLLLSHVQLLD